MKLRNAFWGGIILLAVFGLTSCKRKSWDEESANREILKVLNKRYQTEFAVDSLEEKNIGQNFTHYVYAASVHQEESGMLFEAQLDTNGGNVTDNYPKVLYGDQMEPLALGILEKSGFDISSFELSYDLTDEKAEDFEAYRKGFHVYVYVDLSTEEEKTSEIARSLEQLFRELHNNGFYYILTIREKEREMYFVHNDTIDIPSEEEIINKISG